MYKVFIDNKPIKFQINPQLIDKPEKLNIWGEIELYLKSDVTALTIELKSDEDFKEVFENHQYVEAAGGLVQRESAFLFIKRGGLWDIPKGKLDPGEVPKEAAVREIEEECGLIAPIIKQHLLDTWHTYPYKGKQVLKRTYWYWLDEGANRVTLVPQEEEGITEVAYFEREAFGAVLSNTYLSIIDVIEALEKNS